MSRTHFRTALALLLLGTGACAQTFDATNLGVPVTMASDAGLVPQGTNFKVESKALWFAWGVFPISNPSLQKTLAAELVGGRSVANLRIKTRTRFIDGLVTLATLGVLAPRSVTFEGTIVGAPPTGP